MGWIGLALDGRTYLIRIFLYNVTHMPFQKSVWSLAICGSAKIGGPSNRPPNIEDSLIIRTTIGYPELWKAPKMSGLLQVMSLHLGVLIYGLAEGTLPGPTAAQSLSRLRLSGVFASDLLRDLGALLYFSDSKSCRIAVRMIADSSPDEAHGARFTLSSP